MAPRANWKGHLKIAELACQVGLYTAASTSSRISFHTLNRETGHRVHRQYVDQDTGDVVEKEDQIKGYEVGKEEYVALEPDEIAAAVPDSDKTLTVSAFVPCEEFDDVYLDRPYYLVPADRVADTTYSLIREAMRKRNVAALARTVLFRRVRTVLIRPSGPGLLATTLNFDYEVRSAREAFADIPELKIKGEMLDLAKHIIETKRGEFDPTQFEDRYEEALAEVVRAKIEGREIKRRKAPQPAQVIDLMAALRESAGVTQPLKRTGGRRKAG